MSPDEKTGVGASREFQPVDDPAEALRLLKEGAKTISAAMIWTAGQEQVIHSHLSMLSDLDKHLMVRAPTGFNILAFESELHRKGTPEVFFSVSLLTANIFFRTKYVGANADELAFALPDTIYKVQRRADLRFPIPDGHVLPINHGDVKDPAAMIKRKVLDISAGGLCFLVTPEEAEKYTPKLIIPRITFQLNQKVITVDGEVRHVGPYTDPKRRSPAGRKETWRVGVQFIGMRPADNHAVAAYVFEESRKFFTRFS